ncbi:hypothetical protein ACEWY4_004871 [Coilia grayii]|uniref:G-protein coupled receptors family 1 profile domain-containing protein n=1 Tax=Coilia grayii TaxID=363190 RepID=A0ABD1KMR1_9TELE
MRAGYGFTVLSRLSTRCPNHIKIFRYLPMMENSSATSSRGECCVFSTPILAHVMAPVLIVEFLLGFVSNMLALWMFSFHTEAWKSHSIYLAHLTVSDAVVMLCLPFRAAYYVRGWDWIYGDAFCRFVLFMLATCRAAGIVFLTAVAVDRYFKIIHPQCRINRVGLRFINGICCGLWVFIVAMNVYLLTGNHFLYQGANLQCETFTVCMGFTLLHTWPDIFFVLQFVIPAAIVCFCTCSIIAHLRTNAVNNRSRISRAVYFVMTVALVFITCFLPSAVSRMAVWVLKARYDRCSHFQGASVAFYYLISLTYFNSVLNPALYYFSSPAFDGTIHKLFCKLCRKEAVRTQETQNNTGNATGAEGGN